ncbi:MAG: GGDEF domain-containing protein [Chloroflexi bacterium]|nr:GGDEF domain-containing protein [Chloroflexota bacterium]
MTTFRHRWPLLAGLFSTTLVLVLFAVAAPEDGEAWSNLSPLGVIGYGWAVAMVILATGLGGQILLNARIALSRERRLVETAAALREATAQLELMAATDALTGLPNRRSFSDGLNAEFRRSRRYSRPLAVLMLDLDNFKEMNDTYGHPFGDFLLAEVADTLGRNVRDSDLVARYGGEEFVVMLPETTSDEAVAVAEKLRRAIADREFAQGDLRVQLRVSAGVAGFEGQGLEAPAELVTHADRALYVAKRTGRDRVVDAREIGAKELRAV